MTTTNNTINVDIMTDGGITFYKSLRYRYCRLFKFDNSAVATLVAWILEQLPSIKTRQGVVAYITMPSGKVMEYYFDTNKTNN